MFVPVDTAKSYGLPIDLDKSAFELDCTEPDSLCDC